MAFSRLINCAPSCKSISTEIPARVHLDTGTIVPGDFHDLSIISRVIVQPPTLSQTDLQVFGIRTDRTGFVLS